jgi:hypothetical protein
VIWLLVACGPTKESWTITLAGEPIGVEQRWEVGGAHHRQRSYNLRLGGDPVSFSASSIATLDDGHLLRFESDGPAGHRQAWMDEGQLVTRIDDREHRLFSESPVLLDYVDPKRFVGQSVLWFDPSRFQRRQVDVKEVNGGIGWAGVVWTESRASAGLVSVTSGLRDVTGDVDLLTHLYVPLPTQPLPRASHQATFTVDGVDLSVQRGDAYGPTAGSAERAMRAVRRQMSHHPTPGTRQAIMAMQAGTGDCTEFADAFVVEARAEGLHARSVWGLVYDDGVAGPGLYPHAWAELKWPTNAWISADPSLNQLPADATHIRLGIGPVDAEALAKALASEWAVTELR